MASRKGTTTLTVNSPDKNEGVELEVAYDWWYDAGVRYHTDGSGTPPDGGTEVTGYGEVSGDPLPEWLTDEMVQDALDDADIDFTND
jgi:hypothetical protein